MQELEQLKQWIRESDNIVFLAEPVYRQKAAYQILEV